MTTIHDDERTELRAMTYRWRTTLATVAALGALGAAGCGPQEAESADESVSEAPAGRVINVEVEPLEATVFTEVIDLTGTVEANQDVTVAAEESGNVVRLFVEKGTAVRAGQPIAKIDDRILVSQVEQARAQAELAEETWRRRKRLFEEDNVGSELAYLEARARAQETRAALSTLERRLERTLVRAPIGGILDDRMVEVGTMVNPGTPVARIVDLNPVKVTGGVPERFAGDVEPGSEASVTFDVLPGQVMEGEIRYVGAAVNPRNRTFPVELVLPNPGRAIKPEMVANIRLVRRTLEDVVVIPRDAAVRVEDGFVAFVVVEEDGDRVVEARPLTLGPEQRDLVVVSGGLEPGDRLVVVGQKQVAAGDRVRIVEDR